ncbi:Fungal specific transcription factor domain-containing protein 32 [Elsinoe fawcettii]|nr:Fungal specific transcription factor domain-containing protein 32 [Elsinoe fawcettii]
MTDTTTPEKKRLTRRRGACIRCKHKKIRCDGGQPRCNQCKTDESCMYMPNPTRRRTKKSYKPSGQLAPLRPSLAPNNFYFDPSIASLGQPESTNKPPEAFQQVNWDPLISPPVNDIIPDLTCIPLQWPSIDDLADADLFGDMLNMPVGEELPDLTHSISPSIEAGSRLNSVSGDSLHSCSSSSSGDLDFTLPSATVDATLIGEVLQAMNACPQAGHFVRDLLRSFQDAYTFMDRPVLPDMTLSALTIEMVQHDLLQPETDDYILEYFAAQTSQHVSQARILALKSQILAGGLSLEDDNIALVYCAIAIGCRLRKVRSRRHRASRDSEFYFKRALIWLPRLTSEPPAFSKVEALLPMIMYARSTLCTNFSRYLISEALRMAFALRLNLSTNPASDSGYTEHQAHERMAFMMLYSWEKPLSMRFNVQSAIDDDYIAFELEDVAKRQTPSTSGQVIHDLYFARICSRVSKELCSPKALRNTEKQQAAIREALQSSLEDWSGSVPFTESQEAEELRASMKYGEGTFVLQHWTGDSSLSAARRVLTDAIDIDIHDVDEECLSALLTSFCVVVHSITTRRHAVETGDDMSLLAAACGKMAAIGRHNIGFDYSGFVRLCGSLYESRQDVLSGECLA